MDVGLQIPKGLRGLLVLVAIVAFCAPFVASRAVGAEKPAKGPVVTIEHCYT